LEVDKNGTEVARNILGTNLVSRIVDRASEMYYLYNGHADVTELITPDGTIAAEYTYDAFGVPKTTTGTADNPFRYAGYQYDENGLYYLQSRMYNPVIARFMQEDTYRGQLNDSLSLNLYVYCVNNPIMYIDPTGHVVTKWDTKKLNKAQQAALGIQTRLYDTKKAQGDTAGAAAAHAAAEAIRNTARSSSETGSASGYTYKVNNDGSASLNKHDSTALDQAQKGGGNTLNGSSYLPERYGSAGEIIIQNFNSMMPALNPIKSTNVVQEKVVVASLSAGRFPSTIDTTTYNLSDNFTKIANDFINAYKAHQTSGNLLYDEVNYWTMGLPDALNRNLNSKPFSLENWVASAELLLYCIPESKAATAEGNALRKELTRIIDDVGKGTSSSAKWIDEAGNLKWPTNDGFAGIPKAQTLRKGTIIDRYGYESGTYASPAGTPFGKRALPSSYEYDRPLKTYEVLKPYEVQAGKIKSWFDQPGGGIQYKFEKSIQELLDEGILREINK